MPFHRFEDFKSYRFNPHLSTAEGPVIEGETLYFRMVTKKAGTGAELHYHPNELLAFPLSGKVDCIVGKDRRILQPGMLVHFPPYARHGFKATEDGDLKYLYIKDRTWTLIGAAADEALPDKALSATEVQKKIKAGEYPGQKRDAGKSKAIIEGLGNCYYPMIESLDAPPASGHCERWVEGTHIAFGFVESPPGHVSEARRADHEIVRVRDRRRARCAGGEEDAESRDRRRHPRAARRGLSLERHERGARALRRSALDAAARGRDQQERRRGQLAGLKYAEVT